MTTEDLDTKWKLIVMNILYDMLYDVPDDVTKSHLMKLYGMMQEEPASDYIGKIADEVFGNLPHDGGE